MPKQKHGSIIYQINERLKSMQRFGESKHDAKEEYRNNQKANGEKFNPAYADGIFSYKTYDAYKQTGGYAIFIAYHLKNKNSKLSLSQTLPHGTL